MHINPMKAAVQRGELQIGTWINLVRNPAILTLLKNAGLDFARIDMEHSALSIESLADMAMLARALEFPIAVRPPHANREWITRLLDCGGWNLHCPQVENLAHAREIADAAHYAPRGNRGMSGTSPATEYEFKPVLERNKLANDQVHVTVMFSSGRPDTLRRDLVRRLLAIIVNDVRPENTNVSASVEIRQFEPGMYLTARDQ